MVANFVSVKATTAYLLDLLGLLVQRLIEKWWMPFMHSESGDRMPGDPPCWPSHFTKPNFFGIEKSKKYGRIYHIWHRLTPVVVLCDAEAIRSFYKDHFAHKRDADFTCAGPVFKMMLGDSLGVAHGREEVRKYRGNFEPHFTTSGIYNMHPYIGRAVQDWIHDLPLDQPVNLAQAGMTTIPFNVLTVMMYGEEVLNKHLTDVQHLFQIHNEALGNTNSLWTQVPLVEYLPISMTNKVHRFNKEWRLFHDKLLRDRKAGHLKSCDGLFFTLVDHMHSGLVQLSMKQLRETIDEIMLLNVDISYAAASFILYDLAKHQDVQEEVLDELHNQCQDIEVSQLEDFSRQLPYLTSVIKESARMHPALGLTFPEKTVKDLTDLNGYSVPAGTTVCIDPFSVNHDPEYWPDPEKFDPRRFSTDQVIKPYTFFRFGLGPRRCLGYRLADSLITVAVASLVKQYHIRTDDTDSAITVKPDGMPFFTPYLIPKLIFTARKTC